jgi:flagellar biosynthesis GTPase FlhF
MKSYFADSVQVAMDRARTELGTEAVLVATRATGVEARALGQYEVVFATELPEQSTATVSAAASAYLPDPPVASEPTRSSRPIDDIAAEIRDLRRQFQSWRQHTLQSSDQPRWVAASPQLELLFGEMLAAEVDRELALHLLAAAETFLRPRVDPAANDINMRFGMEVKSSRRDVPLDPARLRAAVVAGFCSEFRADPSIGRITALVGPPGVGKTATIAKLAVRYGLSCSKPAMLISFDTIRVAACEQLRSYASILGIGFQAVDTNRALAQALEEHRSKDLILIDTPGFAFRDLEGAGDTAEFLARRTDIQKQLVLPASMRSSDLARYSQAYAPFAPSHLIFTRLDEAQFLGPLLSETVRSGMLLSFLGTGQKVPEDLDLADAGTLVNRLLPAQQAESGALSAA